MRLLSCLRWGRWHGGMVVVRFWGRAGGDGKVLGGVLRATDIGMLFSSESFGCRARDRMRVHEYIIYYMFYGQIHGLDHSSTLGLVSCLLYSSCACLIASLRLCFSSGLTSLAFFRSSSSFIACNSPSVGSNCVAFVICRKSAHISWALLD